MEQKINMEQIKQIKKIHNSDLFGIFIETGCAMAVTNSLMNVAGSSKTVYVAETPYSSEYQHAKYGKAKRSVSLEQLDLIFDYWKIYFEATLLERKNITFMFTSTFQIGEYNDISTHGWIGIRTENYIRYFHISIHDSLSREDYIKRIAQIGIDIIAQVDISSKKYTIPSNCCIDIAKIDVSTKDKNGKIIEKIYKDDKSLISSLSKETDENFLCISNGNFVRLEELFRDKSRILLYKGSFNLIHKAHIHNIDIAQKEFDQKPVIVLSYSVYEKGSSNIEVINSRIKISNLLGYDVIITKNGFFNKNTEFLRKKFGQEIVYILGSDTMNRIMESSYNIDPEKTSEWTLNFELKNFCTDFNNTSFYVIQRPEKSLNFLKINALTKYFNSTIQSKENNDLIILMPEHPEFFHYSSTKIRKLIEDKKYDEVKNMVPEIVFNSIMEEDDK